MSKREWTPPNDEDTVRLLRTMPLPEHLGGGLCRHAAGRIDALRAEVLQYGNTMGRIAIALFGDRNNRTDEECAAQAAKVVRERDSLRQHLHDEHRRHVETMDERDALRKALECERRRAERAEAERDALKADAERLDWLANFLADVIIGDADPCLHFIAADGNDQRNSWPQVWRRAIDAARKEGEG